jgi:hypothetical protein
MGMYRQLLAMPEGHPGQLGGDPTMSRMSIRIKCARSLSEYSSSQSLLIPCKIKEKQGVNP